MELHEKVNPKHTAVLVIDVQNDFCAAGGAIMKAGKDIGPVQKMIPNLVNFISKARSFQIPIIFVKAIYDLEYLSKVVLEQREKRNNTPVPLCLKGTWGADFYMVKPLEKDVIVEKHRYSAFTRTDLDDTLQRRRIKTLVVTGGATNVCVESTVRDAFMLDYFVVVVEDCVASQSTVGHEHSLQIMNQFFGEVVPSDRIQLAWKG